MQGAPGLTPGQGTDHILQLRAHVLQLRPNTDCKINQNNNNKFLKNTEEMLNKRSHQ